MIIQLSAPILNERYRNLPTLALQKADSKLIIPLLIVFVVIWELLLIKRGRRIQDVRVSSIDVLRFGLPAMRIMNNYEYFDIIFGCSGVKVSRVIISQLP